MGKLFGTDGIRGKANIYPMTPETIMKIGKATAVYAKSRNLKQKHRIVIGKDTRLSGYMFENALTSGIVSMGVDVILVGPVPTPAIALLTKSLNCDAGIMLSASHNPAEDNGLKIFAEDGFKLNNEAEKKIEEMILSDSELEGVKSSEIGKASRIDDAKGRYVEYVKSTIKNESLSGLKIVLDCANGAAYSIAPNVFSELGAEVFVLHNKPNGRNINKDCGALYPESMKEMVSKVNANIGIALDGDSDRVVFADEKGDLVDGNKIIALCAKYLKENNKLRENTVVATKMANIGFDIAMEKEGISVIKTDVGDRYVLAEVRNRNLSLGGEPNGHILFYDHSNTDDGILVALQILNMMKKTKHTLSELTNFIKIYPEILVNIKVSEKKPFEKMPEVQKRIAESEKKLSSHGRIFVRYSGTENLARVLVEAQTQELADKIANSIADEIKKEVGL